MIRFFKKQVFLQVLVLLVGYNLLVTKMTLDTLQTAKRQELPTAFQANQKEIFDWQAVDTIVGLIQLDDTRIQYPFVQGKDDLEYCNKDYLGRYAVCGSIYLSVQNRKECDENVLLLYGHNMNEKEMFGGLVKYLDKSYLKSHQTGRLTLRDTHFDLHVLGILETDCNNRNLYQVKTPLSKIKQELIRFGLDEKKIRQSEKFLFCSTCKDYESNKRYVLVLEMKEGSKDEVFA